MSAAHLRAVPPALVPDFAALDWGCMGKAVYPSRIQALRALDRQRHKKTFAGRGGIRPYRCASCQRWHLGDRQL